MLSKLVYKYKTYDFVIPNLSSEAIEKHIKRNRYKKKPFICHPKITVAMNKWFKVIYSKQYLTKKYNKTHKEKCKQLGKIRIFTENQKERRRIKGKQNYYKNINKRRKQARNYYYKKNTINQESINIKFVFINWFKPKYEIPKRKYKYIRPIFSNIKIALNWFEPRKTKPYKETLIEYDYNQLKNIKGFMEILSPKYRIPQKSLSLQYYHNNKKRLRKIRSEIDLKTKIEVLSHYSKGNLECKCCKDIDIKHLTIDHIKGDGNKHRKEIKIKGGVAFHRWLKNNNYPKGYQVLCHYCNARKGTRKKCGCTVSKHLKVTTK
ncbi:MAG: hypothetical protein K0S93_75 [Nitrososphaeraceae archaeon]|jgi:hypothetical protein|nr:hypothetical protein [Nitrososphaeraceae archaeon]